MIKFYSHNAPVLKKKKEIRAWLFSIAKVESASIESINYIFCDDEYLLEINKEHLNHNDYTDIITFDLSDLDKELIKAEIYISSQRVKENAKAFGVSNEVELLRVMAHGLLHLLGYNDKTEHEKILMREKEDQVLAMLNLKHKVFHGEH